MVNLMSKKEWIRLNYSNEEAEELSKLAEAPVITATFDNIYEVTERLIELSKQFDTDAFVDNFYKPGDYLILPEDIKEMLNKGELTT